MTADDRAYFSLEHPIRLAHRGSGVLWPENTMYAFEQAVALGYHYIETDVRLTRDRVVVVFHDATVDRTTDGSGEVVKLDWAHLAELDAAHSFDREADFPHRGSGIGIVRFDDLLDTFPHVHFNIDLKAPDMEWAVADVIKRKQADDRLLVGSFYDKRLRRFRRITRGSIATSAGPAEGAALWAASRLGRRGPTVPDAYQIPTRMGPMRLDERMIQGAHATGAQVHVWTINDPEEMERLLALGVDGIVSDRPDLLNEVVGI